MAARPGPPCHLNEVTVMIFASSRQQGFQSAEQRSNNRLAGPLSSRAGRPRSLPLFHRLHKYQITWCRHKWVSLAGDTHDRMMLNAGERRCCSGRRHAKCLCHRRAPTAGEPGDSEKMSQKPPEPNDNGRGSLPSEGLQRSGSILSGSSAPLNFTVVRSLLVFSLVFSRRPTRVSTPHQPGSAS